MQLESSEGLDSTSTYPKWNLTFHFSKFLLFQKILAFKKLKCYNTKNNTVIFWGRM